MVTKGYQKGVYDRVAKTRVARAPSPVRVPQESRNLNIASQAHARAITPANTAPSLYSTIEETLVKTGMTLIAYMTAKAGYEDEVRQALLELVAQTRKENGCINYELHQSLENAAQFVMYENWDTAEDLDAHAKAAPLQTFVRIAGSLLERPAEISKWRMVSEPSGGSS